MATTTTAKPCFAWTIFTLLFILFATGAFYSWSKPTLTQEEADQEELDEWEEWRNQGKHIINTPSERAAFAQALDERDATVSTVPTVADPTPPRKNVAAPNHAVAAHALPHGASPKGLHALHNDKHLRTAFRQQEHPPELSSNATKTHPLT
jgi:hypothetical protein